MAPPADAKLKAPLARPDRRFYSSTPAFGRFGIRWFTRS